MLSEKERKRRLNLAKGWYRSGLSKAKYSEKIGMTVATFDYWLKRYRKSERGQAGGKEEGKGSFIELPGKEQQVPSRFCEVRFPNGVELKLDFSDLGELIKLLKDA